MPFPFSEIVVKTHRTHLQRVPVEIPGFFTVHLNALPSDTIGECREKLVSIIKGFDARKASKAGKEDSASTVGEGLTKDILKLAFAGKEKEEALADGQKVGDLAWGGETPLNQGFTLVLSSDDSAKLKELRVALD